MKIGLELEPSKKEAATLSEGISAFNGKHAPNLEPIEDEKRFHVFARSDDGEIRGGIRATCFWNTLHIELLWISEGTRGQGIGKMIIERAEAYAIENQCGNAFVETTSWQARPFYEKSGYVHIATLNDRPKGHATHYLTKKLVRA